MSISLHLINIYWCSALEFTIKIPFLERDLLAIKNLEQALSLDQCRFYVSKSDEHLQKENVRFKSNDSIG